MEEEGRRRQNSIFFDMMTIVARNFGVKIIKKIEDLLLFYFPNTSDSTDKAAFSDMLSCCSTMLEARKIVNAELEKAKLPPANYIIGIDHGRIDIVRALVSKDETSIFPTSLYVKTKNIIESNIMTIGQDLYQILELLNLTKNYTFKKIDRFMLNVEEAYSIYKAHSSNRDLNSDFLRKISSSLKIQNEKIKKQGIPNIMIVDDEEDVLLTFRAFLMDMKHNVDTFKNVNEALSHLMTVEPDHYDLILTDIKMTPTNGLQFYSKLKALNHKSRIVFITAVDAVDQINLMIPEIEKKYVLQKPVNREKFIQTITMALKNE